jgi:hypothetical protein
MIKNILYVEDGSVDVDELEDSLGNETKVIVYRKGSIMPMLVQPIEPIKTEIDDYNIKFTITEFCRCLAHLIMKDNEDAISAITDIAQRYGVNFTEICKEFDND